MAVAISVFILFVGVAIYLSTGRGAFLIAGYNTMSKEEKEKYDEKEMCKLTGKMMFVVAISVLLIAFGGEYERLYFVIIGIVMMLFAIIIGMVFMNRGARLKN